jgi:antitoxin component of MazEF toxin-antitoxin module
MIKSFVKHGNSNALVLDRAILDLVNIDPSRPVEITTDGTRLIISGVTETQHRKKFRKALAAVNRTHVQTLKRLAE